MPTDDRPTDDLPTDEQVTGGRDDLPPDEPPAGVHPADAPRPAAGAAGPRTFRVLVVPGVNPDRWLRVWQDRLADVPLELVVSEPADAERRLRGGDADVAIVRLPVDRDGLSTIPLYIETTVVVAPREHVFSVAEEVTPDDLADETVIVPDDDLVGWTPPPGEPFVGGPVPTTADAVDLVAAGAGVVLLPQSVERLHHRRGVVARPVTDAPGSAVALVWVTERHDDLTEEFVGIVRGRTAASSRGRGTPPEPSGGRSAKSGGKPGSRSGKPAGGKGSGAKGSGGKGSGGKTTGKAGGRSTGGKTTGGKTTGGKTTGGKSTGGKPGGKKPGGTTPPRRPRRPR
ncbi:LysR family substrate-binding domain-containing protein [Cellulomonas biazotea]|nr:LysR family substrate-binding domain-containing protein [Cellulomonas biazotea]